MQLLEFDPKNIFFSILFFLSGCSLFQARQPAQLDLDLPKEEIGQRPIPTKNSITVVLLSEEMWFCYPDTSIGRGKIYFHKDFERLLEQKKKEFGNNLLVVLKPAKNSSYKTAVDALDYMTIHKISKFAIVKLSEKEEKVLYSPHFLEPPQPVQIQSPSSTTTAIEYDYPVFLVEIRKDQSIWYNVVSDKEDKIAEKVNEPVRENLGKQIAGYKKQCLAQIKKQTYLVKGDPQSKYKLFEKVIAALRDNEEYKYNLITASIEDK